MTTGATATNGELHKVVNIFTAPSEAFRALKERPTWLLPLAVLIFVNCAMVLWYYSVVDIVWMIETSLENAGTDMPADQRAQLVESMGRVSPMVMGASAAVASGVTVLVLLLLGGGYLALVSLATNDGYRFKYWFSLICWASLPVALGSLAAMVNLAVSDASLLPAEELNPLTLANLLGLDVRGGGFGAAMLKYTDVTSIWAVALMVLGYSAWTGKGLAVSASIMMAPLVILVAIVAAVTL